MINENAAILNGTPIYSRKENIVLSNKSSIK